MTSVGVVAAMLLKPCFWYPLRPWSLGLAISAIHLVDSKTNTNYFVVVVSNNNHEHSWDFCYNKIMIQR